MKRLSLLALAAISLAAPIAPAQAASAKEPVPLQEPGNPWLASTLTFSTPLAVVAGASLGAYPFHYLLVPAAVLGLGAGHVYAGDPLRGLAVSGGAPLVVAGSGAVVGVVAMGLFTNYDRSAVLTGGSLIGMIAGGSLYAGWATVDAFHTTERVNRERAGAEAPRQEVTDGNP